MASTKTASPNPISYAELNLQHQVGSEYCTDAEDKFHAADKYLFPYGPPLDDELQSPPSLQPMSPVPYTLSMPSRILGSSLSHHSQGSNHDNYNGHYDRYGSLKRSQMHKINHDNISYTDR